MDNDKNYLLDSLAQTSMCWQRGRPGSITEHPGPFTKTLARCITLPTWDHVPLVHAWEPRGREDQQRPCCPASCSQGTFPQQPDERHTWVKWKQTLLLRRLRKPAYSCRRVRFLQLGLREMGRIPSVSFELLRASPPPQGNFGSLRHARDSFSTYF